MFHFDFPTSLSKRLALGFVFVWFLGGGLIHFINPDFFVRITPPWVPNPLMAVYVSGVFEVLGAVGLLFIFWRKWAGWGLFILTLAVTPANVYMWQNPELFPDVSSTFLNVRLVVQVFLLGCIWWGSQPK